MTKLSYILVIPILFVGCISTKNAKCDQPGYDHIIVDGEQIKYVYNRNVVPYAGYIQMDHFMPSIEDIRTAETITLAQFDIGTYEFAQFGGIVNHRYEKIVVANYVYYVSTDHVDAKCDWYFGLGPSFERYTRQAYVNISELEYLGSIPPPLEDQR